MKPLLPLEIINHIISYAIIPIPQVLKNDIENFVKTREIIYEILLITCINYLPPLPSLHHIVNHVLAFDWRIVEGHSYIPQNNNMKWGLLTPYKRNYLLYDLVFYYNIDDIIIIDRPI